MAKNTDVALTGVEARTILETVQAAYNYFWCQDMSESYLKLNRQNRSSPMTLALESVSVLLVTRIGDEPVSED